MAENHDTVYETIVDYICEYDMDGHTSHEARDNIITWIDEFDLDLNRKIHRVWRNHYHVDILYYILMCIKDEEVVLRLIDDFIERGYRISYIDDDNDSHSCEILEAGIVKNKNPVIVDKLIIVGANVNAHDSSDLRPIHYNIMDNPDVEITKVLLKHNVNIHHRFSGSTPLHLALKNHHRFKIAELLIKNGADLNAFNESFETPLHIAINEILFSADSVNNVKLLIDFGADFNKKYLHFKTSRFAIRTPYYQLQYLICSALDIRSSHRQHLSKYYEIESYMYRSIQLKSRRKILYMRFCNRIDKDMKPY
jgi:hypothetical protein